jgi:hypothetical protein
MPEQPNTNSVQERIKRITCEDEYVAVPVSTKIMVQDESGKGRIDTKALFAEAVRISENDNVQWLVETTES